MLVHVFVSLMSSLLMSSRSFCGDNCGYIEFCIFRNEQCFWALCDQANIGLWTWFTNLWLLCASPLHGLHVEVCFGFWSQASKCIDWCQWPGIFLIRMLVHVFVSVTFISSNGVVGIFVGTIADTCNICIYKNSMPCNIPSSEFRCCRQY